MNVHRLILVLLSLSIPACTGAPPPTGLTVTHASVDVTVASTARPGVVTSSLSEVPMALIPAGEFPMGSVKGSANAKRSEGPQRMVYLDAYEMDVYEVTTKYYAEFLEATQPQTPAAWNQVDLARHGDRPVVGVAWDEAVAYCGWVGKRLPTEAEWEKAARGTDGRSFPWGNEAPTSDRATLTKRWDGYNTPSPVGSLEAGKSPYGLYDMAGNVMEWVSDWYDADYYDTAPVKNPTGPKSGKSGIVRGGGWGFLPVDVRSARRIYPPRDTQCKNIGFRCARDAADQSAISQMGTPKTHKVIVE